MTCRELVEGANLKDAIEHQFVDPRVASLHIHFAAAAATPRGWSAPRFLSYFSESEFCQLLHRSKLRSPMSPAFRYRQQMRTLTSTPSADRL